MESRRKKFSAAFKAKLALAAVKSLEKGFEETLTVIRLGLSEWLRRSFRSTNLIESCFSRADNLCGDVKH